MQTMVPWVPWPQTPALRAPGTSTESLCGPKTLPRAFPHGSSRSGQRVDSSEADSANKKGVEGDGLRFPALRSLAGTALAEGKCSGTELCDSYGSTDKSLAWVLRISPRRFQVRGYRKELPVPSDMRSEYLQAPPLLPFTLHLSTLEWSVADHHLLPLFLRLQEGKKKSKLRSITITCPCRSIKVTDCLF